MNNKTNINEIKDNKKMNNQMNKVFLVNIFLITALLIIICVLSSQTVAAQQTVCCEKITSGLYCQNVQSSECAQGSKQSPTSCKTASFCRSGTCYDSNEGTCADNTPQIVCNNKKGIWSEKSPAQCSLGCCTLGDQAAFVSLVRCKKLSATLGLQTNYNNNIKNEVACVLSVQNQDKGACVFEFEFEKTCKFTTRAECEGTATGPNATKVATKGTFNKGKLCSAEELGTNCGPTTKTTCIPGKDEVYFLDSCGNPANIYDSGKFNDKEYWSKIKDKSESCGPNSANQNSKDCGNCNYLQGSICRKTETTGTKPTYGDNICADLNCKQTSNGKPYKHGESWCVYKDQGELNKANNAVGSRFYKHVCVNGEEVLEQCADFRAEECIENTISTAGGTFSQAACRVNRWQDCTGQTEQIDCENTDKRDCLWRGDLTIGSNTSEGQKGACLPKNTPGIKFWEGNEAKSICAQANTQCTLIFEKGLFGGENCKQNCTCLDAGWTKQQTDVCMGLGDCGPKSNWLGQKGYRPGFKTTTIDIKEGKAAETTTQAGATPTPSPKAF